ncbi:MAG: ATP-binding protein [Myxococcaceae bacterium]
MIQLERSVSPQIERALGRGKSILLLGPRQTGKTTLLRPIPCDLSISLIKTSLRQRYEKDPSLLEQEIEELAKRKNKKLLILLDEVQKVPELLDVAQNFHDSNLAQFILTGSSARKLRKQKANLLPGRVVALHLDPLTLNETPVSKRNLTNLLTYGSLPGILLQENQLDQETDLQSYVETYIEDEIRAESAVRNLSKFSRFLELACSESGKILNFQKLSQEINVAHTTIASYYQILEDCLLLERIEPISESKTRKKLTRTQRFLIFDLGVRRVAAGEPSVLSEHALGDLFEHWVGLELIRCARFSTEPTRIRFWRDPDGPEVDWVIEKNQHFIPIEVKYSKAPGKSDAKHLETFLDEYPNSSKGYIVCRTEQAFQISPRITAIPWQELPGLIDK